MILLVTIKLKYFSRSFPETLKIKKILNSYKMPVHLTVSCLEISHRLLLYFFFFTNKDKETQKQNMQKYKNTLIFPQLKQFQIYTKTKV